MKLAHCLGGLIYLAVGCTGSLRVPDLDAIYGALAKDHNPDRNPVIVIPGILGSKLIDKPTKRVVWGAFSGGYANPNTQEGARLFALPMREGALLSELRAEVVAYGVLDRVRFSLLGLPIELNAYAHILGTLGAGGFRDEELGLADAIDYGDDHFTCFQFAYDWRRDLVESAQALHRYILKKKEYVKGEIKKRFGVDKTDIKFDLVAHSMGGLVARYYLRYGAADLPEDGSAPEITWAGAKHIERVVLVGTPNAGSITALMDLVEGKRFAWFLPAYPPALLGTMPSIYQLLPRGRHRPALRQGTSQDLGDLTTLGLWEQMRWGLLSPGQDRILTQLLPDALDRAHRLHIVQDHLDKCLKRARSFHAAMDAEAVLPEGVELYLFAGDAVDTPSAVEVDPISGALHIISWDPGDGTVLRSSTLLDERIGNPSETYLTTPIDFTGTTFLFADHLGLTKDYTFTDNVLFLLLERR